MTNIFNRGSEWRKWDLHIHSPLSILNNQFPHLAGGEPDWEKFLTKLEALDVAAIAVTDYFTIDGYKKLLEYKKTGRLKNLHTILPNIEFRLNILVSGGKDKERRRLNYHVIFSDEVPIKDIEEHFLHDLSFYYEGNPQDKDDIKRLKRSNIEELGARLLKEHEPFRKQGLGPLEVGAMQAVVDHAEITKLLTDNSKFRGKYLIVLPEELMSLMDWDGQDHHTRKSLLQKCDMVFSSNSKTGQWCLGQPPYAEGEQQFLNEFKTLKPCIHGSDAHRLEDIGLPCALRGSREHTCDVKSGKCDVRHCWIKADPTFEGLKQLLYEPQERVRIQGVNPTPLMSNQSIVNLAIGAAEISNELSINETRLDLNTGLVAVVGAKGAGKTALVDLVAHCYVDRSKSDDKNSFVRRVVDDNPIILTCLTFKDGSSFSKLILDESIVDGGQIVYVAQGELEKYIGDDSDLDTYINNLVFESPTIADSTKAFAYHDSVRNGRDFEKKLSLANKAVAELEEATKPEVTDSVERERKRAIADVEDIENRIKEAESGQTKENIELAEEKQKRLASLKERKDDLIRLRDLLVTATEEFVDVELPTFNATIISINELLKKLGINASFETLTYNQGSDLVATLSTARKEIGETVSAIEAAQKEVSQFEQGVRAHAQLLERKRELAAGLQKLIEAAENLGKKRDDLQNARVDRRQIMRDLLTNVLLQKQQYDTIISDFSEKKRDVLADLNFTAEIRLNEAQFLKKAEGVLDNRKVSIEGDDKNPSVFIALLKHAFGVAKGNQEGIDELLKELDRCENEFKTKIKSQPITVDHFHNLLYCNYMRVIPVVKYKKTNLEKLSLGQKATVLIKIYLAQGDRPIIIDSHDDHLDNEFIMDELVRAVREAKNYRQVILVSNNGNVVINSDAEQIIVACRDEGAISYLSGSIENPEIRDRALRVLEGGPEAFKKRQQKYRLISYS